jgi:hypothetical protein
MLDPYIPFGFETSKMHGMLTPYHNILSCYVLAGRPQNYRSLPSVTPIQ